MQESLLSLEDLAVGYGRHTVLSGINLSLQRGSFTGLLGGNGSGKSTLLKTILDIIPPLNGQVIFHPRGERRPALGYMPQRESLDAIYPLSSFEVVLMVVSGRIGPGLFISKTERAWARQCLAQTGAADLASKLFSELSGGQKQRVLMARALATKPHFLLLDEPTAGIDASATQALMRLLKSIHQAGSQTILMVSHDLNTLRQYVQDVIWIQGNNIVHGPVEQLLSRDKLEQVLDIQLH